MGVDIVAKMALIENFKKTVANYSTGQKSPPPSNFTKSINEMNTFLFYRNL